jgi:hypothetical protein
MCRTGGHHSYKKYKMVHIIQQILGLNLQYQIQEQQDKLVRRNYMKIEIISYITGEKKREVKGGGG